MITIWPRAMSPNVKTDLAQLATILYHYSNILWERGMAEAGRGQNGPGAFVFSEKSLDL